VIRHGVVGEAGARRLRALWFAAALSLACADTARAQRDLTLTDAVTRALAKNRDIAIERENVQQAESGVERAQSFYDPLFRADGRYKDQHLPVTSLLSGAPEGELSPFFREFAGSASYSQLLGSGASVTFSTSVARDSSNNFLTLISPGWFTALGAEVRQPLLQNREIDPARRAIKVAAVSRDRSQAVLRRTITETVAAVEQAYWALMAADQDVETRRTTVGLAERQLEDVAARIEGKILPESEIAQPRVEIARRKGDLLTAIDARQRAERALKLLMFDSASDPGWDEPIRLVDAPGPAAATVDLPAALAVAAKERPELADVDARVALQDVEIAAARDRLRPQLDLVGSYYTRGLAGDRNAGAITIPAFPENFPDEMHGGLGASLESTFLNRFPDAMVGIQFTMPIGQHAAKADVATAESTRRQVLDTRERLLLQIGVEVRNAVTGIDTALARVDVARAAREAAEIQLQAEQDRYAAGATTTFLVLTRQNDLATSRLGETSALAAYRRALVELSRARGTLLAERRIELTPAR